MQQRYLQQQKLKSFTSQQLYEVKLLKSTIVEIKKLYQPFTAKDLADYISTIVEIKKLYQPKDGLNVVEISTIVEIKKLYQPTAL